MWDTISHIVGDLTTLLIILAAGLAVLAIAGKIKTKWIDLNCSPRSRRMPLLIIAFIFVALAATNAMLPRLTNPPTIEEMILKDGGKFEWQWAGQNWIGNLEFKRGSNNEITAWLDLNKYLGTEAVSDVMRTSQPGQVKLSNGYIEISDLRVKMSEFELVPIGADGKSIEGISKKTTSIKVLSITNLRPVVAFAGVINYQHREAGENDRIVNEGTGDIVLVKYSSGKRF
jgi:hypothetical protein